MAFHACIGAHWQRLKRRRSVLTLISSSQCTHWSIDSCANHLETFFLGEPIWQIWLSRRPCPPYFPHQKLIFLFFQGTCTLTVFVIPVWNVVRYCFECLAWAALTTAAFLLQGCLYSDARPSQLKPCKGKNANSQKYDSDFEGIPSQSVPSDERDFRNHLMK